jgi:cytochrome P450/NADPH-cytochrome P450 reductase
MVMAMLLQNFDFQLDDTAYKLRIKQTLTIKPDNFKMRATLRHNMDTKVLEKVLRGAAAPHSDISTISKELRNANISGDTKPMTILYGSNTGTCMTFAQRLAYRAAGYGFKSTVMEMNAAINNLPKSQPVIVITASYEGEPPDNAAQFVAWVQKLEPLSLTGVEYAVFGCGHGDWTATYQRIPTVVDESLARCGASRLVSRGSADAAKGNMPADFDDWLSTSTWVAIGGKTHSFAQEETKGGLDVEISTQPGISSLRTDVKSGRVLEAKVLTAPGEPEKRHLEIELPPDMSYECGDYLAVLPLNSSVNVKRVMSRFGLSWDATIVIKGQTFGALPIHEALSIRDVITGHVELFEPASKKVGVLKSYNGSVFINIS